MDKFVIEVVAHFWTSSLIMQDQTFEHVKKTTVNIHLF